MTETTSILQQYLEKAYALYGKAVRLVAVDRAARRIMKEVNELISALEEYINYNIEYDAVEVSNKLTYYEKQLKMIEEKKDSMLLRSFREMTRKQNGKLGSLPQED
ncbi:hypothetical protein STK_13440 [Sulfurisphaera tokodaii str. 7]|uniref:Uncharacterized protein n=1 Tax=Sulfurisphaera tokodaii (strain DSM 16993 / JCM 10545 / NBRC 100140 / 7) TaxID=273063 RepID=Q971L7_SULTO|nr:hypothetical protein [Sulfurisphaera tokodaii]BAB66403.1 hypothetical protein STK_13440 [Sulfurisphaera tokodaii str. 7]